MRVLKHRWVRSVAVTAVAIAAAGCSNDVARLNDGFYTGAVPQQTQMAQAGGYSQPVDATSTGSITPNYPAAAPMNAGLGASSQVQRSQLPPPPGAQPAAYQPDLQPVITTAQLPNAQGAVVQAPAQGQGNAGAVPQQRPASAPTQTAGVPQAPSAPAAPTQTAAAPAASGRTVTVQSGDSLNAIARRTGVSVADLRAANGLASDNIRIGQTLNLPGNSANTQVASLGVPETTLQAQAAAQAPSRAQAEVQASAPAPAQPAQTQPAAAAAAQTQAQTPAPAATTVEEQSRTAAVAPAATGISQFRWPVQGRVVKGFGDRVGSRRSDGLNISVPQGTAIKAAENGVVIYAGEGLREFGKTVLIRHDNGLVTVYGHADEILVERGATVQRGQDIAKAGMTGEADQPMLHFEVRRDSTPVDPMTFLG